MYQACFSDHNSKKLKINSRRKNGKKKPKHMETKQHATKKPMGQWENQEEIKKDLETNVNGKTTSPNLWDAAKKAILREKFIAIQAFSNKQHNLPLTT